MAEKTCNHCGKKYNHNQMHWHSECRAILKEAGKEMYVEDVPDETELMFRAALSPKEARPKILPPETKQPVINDSILGKTVSQEWMSKRKIIPKEERAAYRKEYIKHYMRKYRANIALGEQEKDKA